MPDLSIQDVNPKLAQPAAEPESTSPVVPKQPEPIVAEPVKPEPEPEPEPKRGPTGWIPPQRLNEVIGERESARLEAQRERDERVRVQAQLEALQNEKKPKLYSVDEVQAMLDRGEVTAVQAMSYFAALSKEQAKVEFRAEQQRLDALRTDQDKIRRYSAVVPGWNRAGTEANAKAEAAAAELRARGMQPGPYLDATALHMAFGDVSLLEKTKQSVVTIEPETEQGVGGGTRPEDVSKKDPLKTLRPDEKVTYERLINSGVYQNWDQVREEVAFAAKQTINPALRARALSS